MIRRSCGRRVAERRRRAHCEPSTVGTRRRGHSGVSIACCNKAYNFHAPQVMGQPFRASTTAPGRRGRALSPGSSLRRRGGKTARAPAAEKPKSPSPAAAREGLGRGLRITGPEVAHLLDCRARSAWQIRNIAASACSCGHQSCPANRSQRSLRRQIDRRTLPSQRRVARSPLG